MKAYRIQNTNPYQNLAMEQLLLQSASEPTLLLWQNEGCVVIGRCQNAWAEVNVPYCREHGIHIVRRDTGGGAVYHDLGNINYSFLIPRRQYDVPRQTRVITNALSSFGLSAALSGRNDILAEGKKVSGCAYRLGETCLHHGTLLVDVDFERMSRCLTPSSQKLQAKGIQSVRSRVANLRELCPGIEIHSLAEAVHQAFCAEYGPCDLSAELPDIPGLAEETARLSADQWKFLTCPPFDARLERRFAWGGIELYLRVKGGVVEEATVFSDAMDQDAVLRLPGLLEGCAYGTGMAQAIKEKEPSGMADDLSAWFSSL